MVRRLTPVFLAVLLAMTGGCGGSAESPTTSSKDSTGRTVQFVGFDASRELVEALKDGRVQGLVLQDPYKMGQLGVRTLVKHLEKESVEPKVSTGERMATPENLDDPEIAKLLNPPRAQGTVSAKATGTGKVWRIMVIPKGTTHQFWQSIHAGADKAAEELGNVEVVFQGPEKESDRNRQIDLVQTAIGAGYDGIVLAPLDSEALVGPVEEAVAKGIGVVIIDSALESDKPAAFVATDNYNGGVLGARRLGELLGGKGQIILLRYAAGSASTMEREKGFLDTIAKEYPMISYLSNDQYAGATADTAQERAQNLVARYRGRVDGIFCPNESSAFGMLRALEAAGMVKPRPTP